jgi:hypothetical protein
VTTAYQTESAAAHGAHADGWVHAGTGKCRFTDLQVVPLDPSGTPMEAAITGCDLSVRVTLKCSVPCEVSYVLVELCDVNGIRVIDVNTTRLGPLTMRRGERTCVSFVLRNVLLKPGPYRLGMWMGRSGFENIDHVRFADQIEIHDDLNQNKQSATFDGIYQCEFTEAVQVLDEPAIVDR